MHLNGVVAQPLQLRSTLIQRLDYFYRIEFFIDLFSYDKTPTRVQ